MKVRKINTVVPSVKKCSNKNKTPNFGSTVIHEYESSRFNSTRGYIETAKYMINEFEEKYLKSSGSDFDFEYSRYGVAYGERGTSRVHINYAEQKESYHEYNIDVHNVAKLQVGLDGTCAPLDYKYSYILRKLNNPNAETYKEYDKAVAEYVASPAEKPKPVAAFETFKDGKFLLFAKKTEKEVKYRPESSPDVDTKISSNAAVAMYATQEEALKHIKL